MLADWLVKKFRSHRGLPAEWEKHLYEWVEKNDMEVEDLPESFSHYLKKDEVPQETTGKKRKVPAKPNRKKKGKINSSESSARLPLATTSTGPIGLPNLGATCYLNSLVQAFRDISSVKTWFEMQAKFEKESAVNEPVVDNRNYEAFTDSMKYLLTVAESPRNLDNDFNCKVRSIVDFMDTTLKTQQDPQEVRSALLSSNKSTIGPWDFVMVSTVTCSNCQSSTYQLEPYKDLELQLSQDVREETLTELIKSFLQQEVLKDDNKFQCTTCDTKTNATRELTFKSTPDVLVVNVKRTNYNNSAEKNSNPLKLEKKIYVQDEEGRVGYSLKSAVKHRGITADSGHYICYTNTCDKWWKCDDKVVYEINFKREEAMKECVQFDDDGGNIVNRFCTHVLVYEKEKKKGGEHDVIVI